MKPHKLLLSSLLLASMACTRPPQERPGVEDQLDTTPKTPAQEPTVTPPGSVHEEWLQADPIAPDQDDTDALGTSLPPVGTPDPDDVR